MVWVGTCSTINEVLNQEHHSRTARRLRVIMNKGLHLPATGVGQRLANGRHTCQHNLISQGVSDKLAVDVGKPFFFTTEFGAMLAIFGTVVAIVFVRPPLLGRKRAGSEVDMPTVPARAG
jgi:hypothetical protein